MGTGDEVATKGYGELLARLRGYMRRFSEARPDTEFVQQAVAQVARQVRCWPSNSSSASIQSSW